MKPQFPLFTKPLERWILLTLTAVAIALSYITLGDPARTTWLAKFASSTRAEDSPKPLPALPTIRSVSALGRLKPKGEILRLSAPYSVDGSSIRIKKLLVQEGDYVKAGQVVAILDNWPQRAAALRRAKTGVDVAKAQLNKVLAGVPQGDIEAQTERVNRLAVELNYQMAIHDTRIARLTTEWQNAQVNLRRYEQLHQVGAISTADIDSRRLVTETALKQLQEAQKAQQQAIATLQKQIKEAQASLKAMSDVRPVDVQVAQTQLSQEEAIMNQTQVALEATYIRAPIAGQVLKIHTSPGEILGNEGIAEIGRTQSMVVIAEVYETDIQRVRLGQAATVTTPAVRDVLTGTVSKIGLQVKSQSILGVSPDAETDKRVIEVEIQLDAKSSRKVSHLSNLQVQVVLQ